MAYVVPEFSQVEIRLAGAKVPRRGRFAKSPAKAACLACARGPLPPAGSSGTSCGSIRDRKSTRLNSSHVRISYAVFCLKKKKKTVNVSLTDTDHRLCYLQQR